MRKIVFILAAIAALNSCKKSDKEFFDKFPPEVLFYEGDAVQNPDFVRTTLPAGVSEWTVKARVSAPRLLKEIKLYKKTGGAESLLETYSDFRLSPNVHHVNHALTGITAETTVRIDAVDMDGKPTSRTFVIHVTP